MEMQFDMETYGFWYKSFYSLLEEHWRVEPSGKTPSSLGKKTGLKVRSLGV